MYSANLKYRAKECEGRVELGEKASVESPALISKKREKKPPCFCLVWP